MAYCNHMIQLGAKSGIRSYKLRSSSINRLMASANSYSSLSSNSSDYQLDYEHILPNEKRIYPVDTHALIRSLEAQGVPTKHAEAMTSAMTLYSSVILEYMSQNFVSKAEIQKVLMTQEGKFSKFKSELQSSHDCLRNDIEKMRGEQKYEIDKLAAGQRLDMNLEKRHTREELNNQNVKITNLDNKFDREIHAVRAENKAEQVASKHEVFKYCIGFLFSASAVCVGLLRTFITKQ